MRHLRQPPPRHLSIISQLGILLGGMTNVFGWIFFIFGSIFIWVFGYNSEARFIFEPPLSQWETATGVIMAGEPTNSSVNEQKVWEYTFQVFTDDNSFSGSSYTLTNRLREGQEVEVLFLPDDISTAYIKGSMRAPFPSWIIFIVGIFPLVGLGFIIFNVRKNAHFLRLLINGQFTRGTKQSAAQTGAMMTINGRQYPQYKFEFNFHVGSVSHAVTCKTYHPHKLEDEEEEIILYNPSDPGDAVVYDSIKNAPQINNQGQLDELPWKKSWVVLLPILAILEHYMFYRIFVEMNLFSF